jgi:hypothetical protein
MRPEEQKLCIEGVQEGKYQQFERRAREGYEPVDDLKRDGLGESSSEGGGAGVVGSLGGEDGTCTRGRSHQSHLLSR